MRFRALPVLAGLIAVPVWFAACFTEVGNAEDDKLVSGEFKIDYAPDPRPLPKAATVAVDLDSVFIRQFYLDLREAEFRTIDSATGRTVEKHIWKNDSATLPVDFTGKDTLSDLPIQSMGAFKPNNLLLQCLIPAHRSLKPDTVDLARFSDQGYIIGTVGSGKSVLPFLFLLPQVGEIHLEYSKEALGTWYRDNRYNCEFTFFATKWMEGTGIEKADPTRDKRGSSLIILDPDHNTALYNILVDRFYKSFNTLKVVADTRSLR